MKWLLCMCVLGGPGLLRTLCIAISRMLHTSSLMFLLCLLLSCFSRLDGWRFGGDCLVSDHATPGVTWGGSGNGSGSQVNIFEQGCQFISGLTLERHYWTLH